MISWRKVFVFLALFAFCSFLKADVPVAGTYTGLLAYEPFDGAAGPLYGVASGAGWAAPWDVQGGSSAVPGINIASVQPLQSTGMSQAGNYVTGGYNYLWAGRCLDAGTSGPFAAYLTNGLIGANSTTLWMSVLLRKDADTDEAFGLVLHPGATAWWAVNPGVMVGYFGGSSNLGSTRYWGLQVDGAVSSSTTPVVTGQAVLLVVRFDFAPTTTVRLYVNPLSGTNLPDTADAQATTSRPVPFQSVAYYGGSTTGQTSMDELRFATDYASLYTGSMFPSAPGNLAASPGDASVKLTWDTIPAVTGYQVWAAAGQNASTLLTTTQNTTAVHTNAVNGTTYTYRVVALNGTSSSPASNPAVATPKAQVHASASVGTNLTTVVDYTREWPFVDIFKVARTWIPQEQGLGWGQGPPLTLTPDGWPAVLAPGQYAETLIYDNGIDAAASYPTGQYTLTYDGEGTIAFDNGSATIVSQNPGSIVVNVPAGGSGIYLKITQTNSSNPLRNIHFIMPGFASTWQTQPFHPQFLASLKGYKVLRFMEWSLTNGSSVQNWVDRATPGDYTYTLRGVPLETAIQLANATQIAPWFNIPAQATDDYVRHFATLVQQQLNPNLKFYLEYSNETWNSSFSQSQYVQQQGELAGLSQDAVQAGAFYTAQRSVAIFNIFSQVFGGTARMVRVLPGQAGNAWVSQQVASFQNASNSADALAIAPYFDCDDRAAGGPPALNDASVAAQVAAMSVADALTAELSHINNCAKQQMTENAAVAQQYGLLLVGYEGGQSLVASSSAAAYNSQLTQLFAAVNRDPGMEALYDQYLLNWKNAGGDVFVHFTDVTSYSQYGNFGSMESQDQDPTTAPKYQSLMKFGADASAAE
jgi:hypothetical protein